MDGEATDFGKNQILIEKQKYKIENNNTTTTTATKKQPKKKPQNHSALESWLCGLVSMHDAIASIPHNTDKEKNTSNSKIMKKKLN